MNSKKIYPSTDSCYFTIWGMVLNHCESGCPKFNRHLNMRPFGIQPLFVHWNIKLVWFSDLHCAINKYWITLKIISPNYPYFKSYHNIQNRWTTVSADFIDRIRSEPVFSHRRFFKTNKQLYHCRGWQLKGSLGINIYFFQILLDDPFLYGCSWSNVW